MNSTVTNNRVLTVILSLLLLSRLSHSSISCSSHGEGQDIDTPEGMNMSCAQDKQDQVDLYLLVMAPLPNLTQFPCWDGSALIPAARLAVEEINIQSDMLQNYKIHTIEINSGCSLLGDEATLGYLREVFYRNHTESQAIVGIVGPACTDTSFIVERIGRRLPLVQVTVAFSIALRDKKEFPYVLSTISSSARFAQTVQKLLREQGWKRIGIIFEHTDITIELYNSLEETDKVNRIQVTKTSLPLESIFDSHLRILVVLASSPVIERLLCAAYRFNRVRMTYPAFQWILVEQSNYTIGNSDCTEPEIQAAFNECIFLSYNIATADNTKLVSNQTYEEYSEAYSRKADEYENETGCEVVPNLYRNLYYDAVWAFGLALDKVLKGPNSSQLVLSRNMTSIPDAEFADMLRDAMLGLDAFSGTSGVINFQNDTGDTRTNVDIFQLKNGSPTKVGQFQDEYFENLTATFISDSFNIEFATPIPLLVVLLLVIVVLFLLIVVYHSLSIAYRNRRSIKASSPRLSHLMYCGCYMISIGLFLDVIGEAIQFTDSEGGLVLCYTYRFLLEVGVTVMLATIVTRTWRIYRLFVHLWHPGGFFLRDSFLSLIVLILVTPVLVKMLFTLAQPFQLITSENFKISGDEIHFEQQRLCSRPLWNRLVYYFYVSFLLLCSLVLAILNRNIDYSQFKVTKYISFFVYAEAVVSAFGFTFAYLAQVLGWSTSARNVLLIFSYTLFLTVCIVFVFTPPLLPVLAEKLPRNSREALCKRSKLFRTPAKDVPVL